MNPLTNHPEYPARGEYRVNHDIPSVSSTPKGVGGWLLLLIVMLAVYTPAMGFRNLYYDFIVSARVLPALETNQAWVQYRMAVWIVYGIMCFFCCTAGYTLWRIHRPMTVQLAIGVIWLAGPFIPVIHAAAASAIFHLDFTQTVKPFYIAITASAIQCAIWTGYLIRSARVKNTYYSVINTGSETGK